MKNRIGSNQFRIKPKVSLRAKILASIIMISAVLWALHHIFYGIDAGLKVTKAWAEETLIHKEIVSPLPAQEEKTASVSAQPTLMEEKMSAFMKKQIEVNKHVVEWMRAQETLNDYLTK